jgi:hypothetical protein
VHQASTQTADGGRQRHRLVGLPVAHAEGVRHDARARRELQQLRAQLQVDLVEQEHRDHRRARQVGLEQVLLLEARALGHALALRALPRERDQVGVQLDAHRGRAALRGGDDGTAVAGTEIEHDVARPDRREVEHPRHQLVGRGHPDDVLAGLADRGYVGFGRAIRALRVGAGGGEAQRGGDGEVSQHGGDGHGGSEGGGRTRDATRVQPFGPRRNRSTPSRK